MVPASGLSSLWLGQVYDLDALTALAVIGRHVDQITLGTAVTTTYPRHPIVMSGQAQTAHAATGWRLVPGLGVSHRDLVERRLGYTFDRPARHLREYLAALTSLLDTGEVDFHGDTIVADTTGWPGRVPGATPPPPVLVAALSPAMLRAAGELTDGTISWLAGPRTLADHIVPTITDAAKGR